MIYSQWLVSVILFVPVLIISLNFCSQRVSLRLSLFIRELYKLRTNKQQNKKQAFICRRHIEKKADTAGGRGGRGSTETVYRITVF